MATPVGPLSDELKAQLKKHLEDTARDPRKIDNEDHGLMKYLMSPQIIIHDRYDEPVYLTGLTGTNKKLDEIIRLGWRYGLQDGSCRLTPTGRRLKKFLEDIGVLSVWTMMYMTRWQMLKRTFYRVVLGKDWWPDLY